MSVEVARDLVVVSSVRPIPDTADFEVVNVYPVVYGSDGLPSLCTTFVTFVLCAHGFTILHDVLGLLAEFGAFSYSVAAHFLREV